MPAAPGHNAVPDRDDPTRVIVLVRAHCPTCDRMEAVVREVCARVGAAWTTIDVDAAATDPELRAEFSDAVPVTLVDGVEVGSSSLDPAALDPAALERALAGTGA